MNTLNKRKELFDKYILNKSTPLDDEVINCFYETCHEDIESNHKYFLPFFKATFKYYENNILNNLSIFKKWFSFFKYKELDHENSKQNYSDLDMFLIISLKINQYLLDKEYIDNLINYYYKLSLITSFDSDFFIKYNLCKFFYTCKNYEKARSIYFDIIVYKREWYILMLPFKYHDYQIFSQVVINVLQAKKISHYDFNIILKYLKESKIDTKSIMYIDYDPSYEQLNEIKEVVIRYIFDNEFEVQIGKLSGKTKSNAGFISNATGSFYINSKDMHKKYKINQEYFFITYDSYDFKKKVKSIDALIIKEVS